MTRLQARDKALTDAFLDADGFEGCIPDTNAAAWFWFIVMTTIGKPPPQLYPDNNHWFMP